MLVRINKHLAQLGYCSRRKADELISLGEVLVNGEVVKEMGMKVDPDKDEVTLLYQKKKDESSDPIYIVLNKPLGYISSTSDKQGRTVLGLLRKENGTGHLKRNITERVYPVGRLDKDSEGLVLLTNDGELTNKLTHPKYEHEKEYEAILDSPLSKDAEQVLTKGMDIGGEHVMGIKIVDKSKRGKQWIVTMILKEGKNRQIKKMFGRIGYNLLSLKRTRIGSLKLGSLALGQWRFVRKDQIV